MTRNIQLERKLLHFSTLFALLFAVMGISLGAWIGSLVIIFDGAYSLVSLFLTLVSVAAASYIHKPRKHPSAINITKVEPMVIAFKGLVITLMCCISFASAVEAILNGGRDVNTGVALIFGVINVLGCIGAYWLMVKKGKRANSGLVDAEAKQWLMDTVISIAVMIGFVFAKILSLTEYQSYAVYADPVMVIIVSIYFIIVPLKMTYKAIQQLALDKQLVSHGNNHDDSISSTS
ncbi:cation transporter [Photobacterium profundum]|uniref:Hypothetical cation efflux system component n=1 Tax=Photobacterium profundum (strain SS9) TaxID=298386 RepID=Q6LSL8_PHOPR|nr:cation transporter [Photobacterium profundum]CAG19708.1 hypothetical cation efflux system component [Photobacterium profundum SS9]